MTGLAMRPAAQHAGCMVDRTLASRSERELMARKVRSQDMPLRPASPSLTGSLWRVPPMPRLTAMKWSVAMPLYSAPSRPREAVKSLHLVTPSALSVCSATWELCSLD